MDAGPTTTRARARARQHAWAFALVTVLALGACRLGQPSTPAAPPTVPAPSLTPTTAAPSGTAPATATSSAVTPTPVRAATATASAPPALAPGVAATLRIGDRIAIAGTGWSLTFREVTEDSRCPVDVQCIWAGQATIRLIATHTDGRTAALAITMAAGAPASATLDGLTVEATALAPAPRAATPIAPDAYTVTVRVGR